MATYKLAVIIKNQLNDDEFLLVKQTPPPKFGDQEYDSYVDSDLWDLPSTQLNSLQGDSSKSQLVAFDDGSCLNKLDLTKFDVDLALNKVTEQVGCTEAKAIKWKFWELVEEPDFGPGLPIQTVYIIGKVQPDDSDILTDRCKWICAERCLECFVEVKPSSDRIGPLVVLGPLKHLMSSGKSSLPSTLRMQEYPPGIKVIPMGSRTAKPFRTTNLVVFAPDIIHDNSGNDSFVAHGDALIVDPGCRSEFHEELMEIVATLPRKLVIFVTHHHNDHIDGLSVVQKRNPDASLLAHENTMCRIRKDCWSLGYTSVSGDEEVCIGGQRLRVIFAPGHTDGHMALLHVSTHSLIVGDHCVGQGSAILDSTSGGNMNEYFKTTYKFMELSPHTLIPMHGRVNLWPKHLLCGYLKNRRARESSILKSIEDGAATLFDIVARTYSDVDRSFWIHASSNVRLHVDHLVQQDKLPKEFSLKKFQKTCGLHFLLRWTWVYFSNAFVTKHSRLGKATLLGAVVVSGFALIYSGRNNLNYFK